MSKKAEYEVDFDRLFEENYTRLYYYALNIINNDEEAKDIVSNVFEYVLLNYHLIDTTTSIRPLLYKLVKSKCIDLLRRQGVKEKYDAYILSEFNISEEYVYEEHDLMITNILNTIESFPPQTRTVFRLCFLDGKKYKEIAEELDISTNTVKAHIMKALQLLRGKYNS